MYTYELSKSWFVHVDTAGLSVMDLTVHNGGVGAGLHLETGDSVVVDVICFEITLKKKTNIWFGFMGSFWNTTRGHKLFISKVTQTHQVPAFQSKYTISERTSWFISMVSKEQR